MRNDTMPSSSSHEAEGALAVLAHGRRVLAIAAIQPGEFLHLRGRGECCAHISRVASLSGVATRITARTWAKDSRPARNAARICGSPGNARATRNRSRAAPSE
jgi:hypothetical protein